MPQYTYSERRQVTNAFDYCRMRARLFKAHLLARSIAVSNDVLFLRTLTHAPGLAMEFIMRVLIRYFFRGVRLVLAPVMLISEKLSTPNAIERAPADQARVDQACQRLALYQFRTCPFCIKVRKEIARLGLTIELRDVQHDPAHKQDLLEGGGKTKVPCLKIHHEDGREEWLYESDDINAWLHQQFGA